MYWSIHQWHNVCIITDTAYIKFVLLILRNCCHWKPAFASRQFAFIYTCRGPNGPSLHSTSRDWTTWNSINGHVVRLLLKNTQRNGQANMKLAPLTSHYIHPLPRYGEQSDTEFGMKVYPSKNQDSQRQNTTTFSRKTAQTTGTQLYWSGIDASKSITRTTIGIVIPQRGLHQTYSVHKFSSVFSAEATAIRVALSITKHHTGRRTVFTDSLSTLKAIKSVSSSSTATVLQISDLIQKTEQPIDLVWTPGHVGIPINEAADIFSRRSTLDGSVRRALDLRDALASGLSSQRQAILLNWQSITSNKALRHIRSKVGRPTAVLAEHQRYYFIAYVLILLH